MFLCTARTANGARRPAEAGATDNGTNGLAVLRSSIQEFLCCEAMHSLGIPTMRALCLVTTRKFIVRNMFDDGNAGRTSAIVCRVAPFLHFGSYQLHASRGKEDLDIVRLLADSAIKHHFPHIENMSKSESLSFSTCFDEQPVAVLWMSSYNKYADWAVKIAKRIASLVAGWQGVSIHELACSCWK